MEEERIDSSDKFEKSKKNILWIFAVLLFLYLAKIKDPIKLKFADIDMSIDRDSLVFAIVLYFFYALLSFTQEFYFTYRRNSTAGRAFSELNAADFVKSSIELINENTSNLKLIVNKISQLEPCIPNNEPVEFEIIGISPISKKELINSVSLVTDEVRGQIDEIVQKLQLKEQFTDELREFQQQSTMKFQLAAQGVIDRFIAGRLEVFKKKSSSDLVSKKSNFKIRMMELNERIESIEIQIQNDSKKLESMSKSFLGISESVHRVAKISFFTLDGFAPIIASLLSIAIILKYVVMGSW